MYERLEWEYKNQKKIHLYLFYTRFLTPSSKSNISIIMVGGFSTTWSIEPQMMMSLNIKVWFHVGFLVSHITLVSAALSPKMTRANASGKINENRCLLVKHFILVYLVIKLKKNEVYCSKETWNWYADCYWVDYDNYLVVRCKLAWHVFPNAFFTELRLLD